jgi:sugar phosphate isomerase/epimerase
MCLPSAKGTVDFRDLFSRLEGVGFNGGLIIEAYQGDYGDYAELFESLYYVKNLSEQIFK